MIVSISRASFLFCSLRRLRLIFYLEEILAQGGMKGKFPAFSNKPGRYCIDEELPREGGTGRFIGSPENHLPEDWIRDLPQIRRMRTEAGRPLARGQQGDESNYSDAQSPPPIHSHMISPPARREWNWVGKHDAYKHFNKQKQANPSDNRG